MQKPKVSVIMAVKNGEKSISNTIDSILNQTLKDFELIIVDDASTDSTADILREYKEKDSRISIITNKKNMERCVSRNSAIKISNGEYLAVTDDDDISLPSRLAKEVVYLDTHKNCYLVGSRAELLDENGKKIGESWGAGKEGNISSELEKENHLVHSSIMFRNTKEFWYRDHFRTAEDYDLFLQMIAGKKELHIIDEILVRYSDKGDLLYNEYLVSQKYFQEAAKYLYFQKKDQYKDLYNKLDYEHIEKYVPKKIIFEMKMKQNFFDKKYKEARKYAKKLINIDPSTEWRLYYLDTFLFGTIFRLGKKIKRKLL